MGVETNEGRETNGGLSKGGSDGIGEMRDAELDCSGGFDSGRIIPCVGIVSVRDVVICPRAF